MHRLRAALLACCMLPAVAAASPAPPPDRFEDVRRSIRARVGAERVPALSVAVAKDGRLIWEEAFGQADLERRVAATTETRFPIASVSKPLTATAVMVLVEQGKLSLERPANDYLDTDIVAEIGDAREVTVRRLMSHTSGLSRHDLSDYLDEAYPPVDIHARIRRYARTARVPGESYEYSNLGYDILAHIVARSSGQSFDRFMRDAVFQPLGMTRTSVGIPDPRPGDVAPSYDGDRRPVPMRHESSGGAGGAFSTAGDLARFGTFHLARNQARGATIVSPARLASMREPQVQTDSTAWYALGWRVDRGAFGVETVYHTGSNGASSSLLAFVPGEDIVVAVLANCVTYIPGQIAREILASFGPRSAPGPHPSGYPATPLAREPYRPGREWIGRWEGMVQAPDESVPIALDFTDAGPILVRLADAAPDTAGGTRIEGGHLRGSFDGEIANPDTRGRRYRLHFKLKQVGDRLAGSVTAGSVPGERVITLSYATELRRTR